MPYVKVPSKSNHVAASSNTNQTTRIHPSCKSLLTNGKQVPARRCKRSAISSQTPFCSPLARCLRHLGPRVACHTRPSFIVPASVFFSPAAPLYLVASNLVVFLFSLKWCGVQTLSASASCILSFAMQRSVHITVLRN